MTDSISVLTMREHIVSFRQKMGIKREPEQYRNMFKMLNILYLSVNQNDPDWPTITEQYRATVQEYVRRMVLMGHSVDGEGS